MHLLRIVLSCVLLLLSNNIKGHQITISLEDCHGIFAGNWGKCSAALKKQLLTWHGWSGMKRDEPCEFLCVSQLKGRMVNLLQWKWDGKFTCESKAPGIVGISTRFSKKDAIDWAVVDFLKKAIATGHIQREDVDWGKTNK